MTRNRHHGTSLESFLAGDGILEEAPYAAAKKVIAAQIAEEMKANGNGTRAARPVA